MAKKRFEAQVYAVRRPGLDAAHMVCSVFEYFFFLLSGDLMQARRQLLEEQKAEKL